MLGQDAAERELEHACPHDTGKGHRQVRTSQLFYYCTDRICTPSRGAGVDHMTAPLLTVALLQPKAAMAVWSTHASWISGADTASAACMCQSHAALPLLPPLYASVRCMYAAAFVS
jgi:hypothetical protein